LFTYLSNDRIHTKIIEYFTKLVLADWRFNFEIVFYELAISAWHESRRTAE